MKTLVRHIKHYLPLFGILGAGFLGFYIFSYDKVFQAGVAVAAAVSYVSWGIIHHHLHNDLQLSIVIEYIAVAVLGLVVIFSVTLR